MAFNCGGSIQRQRRWGLRIGDDKATMEIDISGGGWRWRASAFVGGDGRRWAFAFDGGDGQQLWQRWTIETAFNGGGGSGVRWRQQHSMAFDGVGGGLQQEDERAAQGEATQQPASTMRGREGGVSIQNLHTIAPHYGERLTLMVYLTWLLHVGAVVNIYI